jgi:hypothetical protein
MRKRAYKHHIEILPADRLLKGKAWQTLSDSLPVGAWLLILPKNNNRIYQVILDLAKALEEKGKRVILWATTTEGGAPVVRPSLSGNF